MLVWCTFWAYDEYFHHVDPGSTVAHENSFWKRRFQVGQFSYESLRAAKWHCLADVLSNLALERELAQDYFIRDGLDGILPMPHFDFRLSTFFGADIGSLCGCWHASTDTVPYLDQFFADIQYVTPILV